MKLGALLLEGKATGKVWLIATGLEQISGSHDAFEMLNSVDAFSNQKDANAQLLQYFLKHVGRLDLGSLHDNKIESDEDEITVDNMEDHDQWDDFCEMVAMVEVNLIK